MLAQTTLGAGASSDDISALKAFWFSRGDAVFSGAWAANAEHALEAFSGAVDRHGKTLSPAERIPHLLENPERTAHFQARRSRLYKAAEAEALDRHIRAVRLDRKSDVKAMLLDEFAAYGLQKIKKPHFIDYPALTLGLHWNGGVISLAFDMGGRANLSGHFPFVFWITYADGSVTYLGDFCFLLPGITEYFVCVRGSITPDGRATTEQSPLLATYGIRVALDMPRLLAQAL